MVNQDAHKGPSFSFKNRFQRFIWNLTSEVLFKFSPTPFHKWRAFVLYCFGATVGRDVHVYPRVKIWAPWNLELGNQCGIANGVILYSLDKIKIGKRAVISQGSNICAGTHDYNKPGFPLVTRPVTICDEAWVAAEVFVHPGITIGEGCVVGARSVVTKDMPAWTVCSGHPCEPLKPREMCGIE